MAESNRVDDGGMSPACPMRASTVPLGSRRPDSAALPHGTCPALMEGPLDFAATWPSGRGSLFPKHPPSGRCVDDAFRDGLKAENQSLRAENDVLREAVARARQGVQQRIDRSGGAGEKEISMQRALEKVMPKNSRAVPGASLESPREDAAVDPEMEHPPDKTIVVDLIAPSWRQQTPPMSMRAKSALKAVAPDMDFASAAVGASCLGEGDLVAPRCAGEKELSMQREQEQVMPKNNRLMPGTSLETPRQDAAADKDCQTWTSRQAAEGSSCLGEGDLVAPG